MKSKLYNLKASNPEIAGQWDLRLIIHTISFSFNYSYIIRAKEFERERRLRMRQQRIAKSMADEELAWYMQRL